MKTLTKLVDEVYEGKSISVYGIKWGKRFITDLSRDLEIFGGIIQKYNLEIDKNGWIRGKDLFSLTIEIINREEAPGKEVYTKGGSHVCVTYYGICPELENFVSIILWPETSETSRKTYQKIYDLIRGDEHRKKVLKFSEMYSLQPPNKIHPYRDTGIDTIPKPKAVYDWEYTPYLKEVGETILSHKSPIIFSKVFIEGNNGEIETKYINLKTTIGSIINRRRDEISIVIPYLNPKDKRFPVTELSFLLRNSVLPKLDEIKNKSLINVLIAEETSGNIQRTLYDISLASFPDLVGHFLLFDLYNRHLQSERLYICSVEEYEKLFKDAAVKAERFCNRYKIPIEGYQLCKKELILQFYLLPFFKQIGEKIYYSPSYLSFSEKDLILADKTLLDHKDYKPKWDIPEDIMDGYTSGPVRYEKVVKHIEYSKLKMSMASKKLLAWDEKYQELFEMKGADHE